MAKKTEVATVESPMNGEVRDVTALASSFTIQTEEDFSRSTEMLGSIKGLKTKIEDWMEPITSNLKALKKTVSSQTKALIDPLEAAEAVLKEKRVAFSERNKAVVIDVREYWSAEITDVIVLIRAVAEGKVPADVLSPNMTALNGYAKNLHEAMSMPGVKAVCRKGETFGAKIPEGK